MSSSSKIFYTSLFNLTSEYSAASFSFFYSFLTVEKTRKIPVIIVQPNVSSEQRVNDGGLSHVPCRKDLKLLHLTRIKN